VLPDFITQHLDPFSADDDTADIDAAARGMLRGVPPLLNIPQPSMPQRDASGNVVEAPISRNAPCPCGSGKKYKHCHGQPA
jgi:preprotein translocase subunit SecA